MRIFHKAELRNQVSRSPTFLSALLLIFFFATAFSFVSKSSKAEIIDASFIIETNGERIFVATRPTMGTRRQTLTNAFGEVVGGTEVLWAATDDHFRLDYSISLLPGSEPLDLFQAGLTSLTFSVDSQSEYKIEGDFDLRNGQIDSLYWRARLRHPSRLPPPADRVAVPFDQIHTGNDLVDDLRFGTALASESLVSGSPSGTFVPDLRYTLDLSATLAGLEVRTGAAETTLTGFFSLSLVPEPSSAVLLYLGLAGLATRPRAIRSDSTS